MARLRRRLNTLADSGRPVIADLDQVGFMDASGLGAIVGVSRRATAHGSSFRVVRDSRQIRRLFRLAGLERQIRLARTLVEVLQALESGQLNEMLVINGLLE